MAKHLKKWRGRWLLGSALLLASAIPWQSASAERLLTENFDYPIGTNLYGQGGWVKYGTNANLPITIKEGNLTFSGYMEEQIGAKIALGKTSNGPDQDLMKDFGGNDKAVKSGSVYAAFIANFSSAATSSQAYFFNFVTCVKAGWSDGSTPGEFGRIFAKKNNVTNKLQLGINRNTAVSEAVWSSDVDFNKDHLVILKYEIIEGSTNDKISLWIDPEINGAEPTPAVTYAQTKGGDVGEYGIFGVELRQGQTASYTAPELDFDVLRVATSWADLFDGGANQDNPVITVSNTEINLGTYQHIPVSTDVIVRGENLTDDITVTCPEGVTCNTATIAKEDVMGDGASIRFTVTPEATGYQTYTVKLTSEGADELNVNFLVSVTECAQLKTIAEFATAEEGVYSFGGTGVVTAVVPGSYSGDYDVYVQDATGAVDFSMYVYGDCPFKVGDQLKGGLGYLSSSLGAPYFELLDEQYYPTVQEHNVAVEPLVVTASDYTADFAKQHIYQLITINGAKFASPDGKTFSTSFVDATSAEGTAFKVKAFKGADVIGKALPSKKVNLTGLSMSASIFTMAVRSEADVVESTAEPTIIVDKTYFRLDDILAGFSTTASATLSATDLEGDITVSCPSTIVCDKSVITKDEAMAEGGVTLNFTITPIADGPYTGKVTLKSEGAADVEIEFYIPDVYEVTEISSSTDIINAINAPYFEDGSEMFKYNGKAVITYVETVTGRAGSYVNYYAQDEKGGICFSTNYLNMFSDAEISLAVGDEITNVGGLITRENKAPVFNFVAVPEIVAQGKTVTPAVVGVSEITAANAKDYIFRLVTLQNVKFAPAEGQTTFNDTYIGITDGTTSINGKAFIDAQIIGTDIPTANVNVTGISRSFGAFVLGLMNSSDIELAPAAINAGKTYFRLDYILQGMSAKQAVNITGSNLENDITISCPATIVCDKTVITKEEAMAEGGATINFTITPAASGEYTGKVTLKSEGAADVELEFFCPEVVKVISLPNSTAVMNQLDDPDLEDNMYKYNGKAVITYVESITSRAGTYKKYYAQDMFGGLCFSTQYYDTDQTLNVGDEITGIYGVLMTEMKAPVFYMMPDQTTGMVAEVTATGKSKTPTPVKIADITATTAESYIYRLIQLDGITFQPNEGETKFSESSIAITDGDKTAMAMPFIGSQIIGTDIPAGPVNAVGISRSIQGLTLGLMNSSDLEGAAPSVVITATKEFDFTNNAAPVGEKTLVYKYGVVANNLKVAAPVTITGANADQFVAEPAEIPAGSSITTVSVYYQPTAVGTAKGNVYFDFDGTSSEFNQSFSLSCKAYDPDNLPSVTILPAEVELVAKPGEKVTAEVKLTASGCFDYITGTRQGTGDNGGITVSSTYMLPTSVDAPIVVTFQPKAEGEYSETFTYTTTMCAQPATLTIKAICKGQVDPEPTEGQEFELSTANPLAWYMQDFTTVEKDKVLSIEGWTNSALEGQRAWWGYVGEEDGEEFHAAKCTAYDSKLTAGNGIEKQQMILVSPALDYKNAESKMLKFRLMGKYLTEGSGDLLEVCLVEPNGDGYDIYPMNGFNIPATAEEAGQWIPYDVDMSVVPDMADTFFIGFRFSYTRGVDSATTYYITDFEWSKKPNSLEGIKTDNILYGAKADGDGLYSVYNTQGIRVLRVADAQSLKRLPAGFYIVGGKKVYLK